MHALHAWRIRPCKEAFAVPSMTFGDVSNKTLADGIAQSDLRAVWREFETRPTWVISAVLLGKALCYKFLTGTPC